MSLPSLRRFVRYWFNLAGYDVIKIPKRTHRAIARHTAEVVGGKVYLGCGDDFRDGYIGCDIRKTPAVDIVCKAWELSHYCRSLDEIYTRHMVEHMTFPEVRAALEDWYKSLRVGGSIAVIVPNMDFHVAQWQNSRWDSDGEYSKKTNEVWSCAGFWGWQRECDPTLDNYNTSYWDVHKSGFNKLSLQYFLKSAGFSRIEIWVEDECHLCANAIKAL